MPFFGYAIRTGIGISTWECLLYRLVSWKHSWILLILPHTYSMAPNKHIHKCKYHKQTITLGWPLNLEKTWNWIFCLKNLEKTLDFFWKVLKTWKKPGNFIWHSNVWANRSPWNFFFQMNCPPYTIVDFSLVFWQILKF